MLRKLHNHFFWLLLSLVAFFIVTPLIVNSSADMYIFGLLFSAILLASVYIITHNRWLIVSAIVLATLVFVGLWVNNLLTSNHVLMSIEYFLMTFYFLMITIIVLQSVFADREVNFNTICGAICGYLLIGLVWSFFYSMIHFYNDGAFNFSRAHEIVFDSNFQQFTYYSFVTLTTLGYGDITPLTSVAKTLAWIEAAVGQVYLTVWIAQLVGLNIAERIRKREGRHR